MYMCVYVCDLMYIPSKWYTTVLILKLAWNYYCINFLIYVFKTIVADKGCSILYVTCSSLSSLNMVSSYIPLTIITIVFYYWLLSYVYLSCTFVSRNLVFSICHFHQYYNDCCFQYVIVYCCCLFVVVLVLVPET